MGRVLQFLLESMQVKAEFALGKKQTNKNKQTLMPMLCLLVESRLCWFLVLKFNC